METNNDSKELEELKNKINKYEYDSQRDILKYFDRIHDKLFTFNVFFITGYMALSRINKEFYSYILILPLICFSLLLFIEYKMLKIARNNINLTKINLKEHFKNQNKKQDEVNIISLFVIILSAIELTYTIYVCIFKF